MTLTTRKQKKCRAPGCEKEFMPYRSTQKVCGPSCALALAEHERQKSPIKARRVQKRVNREKLDRLKSRSKLTEEAQKEFNRYIRERDHGRPCISCGGFCNVADTLTGGGMQAGHFKSVKAHPELRFEPMNCHAQCSYCNNHLSGNQLEYRKRLIEVIGAEAMAWLEGPHEAKRYREDELRQIRDHFRAEANRLRKQREKGGGNAGQ